MKYDSEVDWELCINQEITIRALGIRAYIDNRVLCHIQAQASD